MVNQELWYFGWQFGNILPVPVKFDAGVLKPKDLLIVYKLNDDESEMNLRDLEARYPYKEIP